MIINPIIPIWLMLIICIIMIILVILNKPLKDKTKQVNNERTSRQNELIKRHIINVLIKIAIIINLFIINLRFMIPNGETISYNMDLNVLFVIDKSVSMKALDYSGNKERIEGVITDCCNIVDELPGAKFSIITFGDTAQKEIPFTTDSNMVQAELKSIHVEDDFYAKGTSINIVNEIFEKTLKNEMEKQKGNAKFVVFFVSDGEITKEGEKLSSFKNIAPYISDGAVLGYGTQDGGKMVSRLYEDDPTNPSYYIYYYDENYKKVTGLSKIDERNLNQIANDIGIDYINMAKSSNINSKLNSIKKEQASSETTEQKIKSYQDIYYYFVIPLLILLIVDFIIKKRRM